MGQPAGGRMLNSRFAIAEACSRNASQDRAMQDRGHLTTSFANERSMKIDRMTIARAST